MRAVDISKIISASPHYVSKVLRKLVTAKLLNAEKGHRGGFTLAKPANQIKFIHVIQAVGPKIGVKHCIFGWRSCDAAKPCILHHRWQKVSGSFLNWARLTSLADIQSDAVKSDWLFDSSRAKRTTKKTKNSSAGHKLRK